VELKDDIIHVAAQLKLKSVFTKSTVIFAVAARRAAHFDILDFLILQFPCPGGSV